MVQEAVDDYSAYMTTALDSVRSLQDAERFLVGVMVTHTCATMSRPMVHEIAEAAHRLLYAQGLRLPCGCMPALRITCVPRAHYVEVKLVHPFGEGLHLGGGNP